MRIASLLPDDKAGRSLALVALIDSLGTGFFIAGSILFLTRGLGFAPGKVGAGIAIANAIGFIVTVPLGMLSDRLGAKRTLAVMYAWHALWMAALPFVGSFPTFVVVFTMVTIGDCGAIAVMQALVSSAVGPERRTKTLGYMRSWRNVGFTVGAALTAPLLAFDTKAAYATIILANAVFYAAAALVISRLRLVGESGDDERGERRWFPRALDDWPYLGLTLLAAAMTIHLTFLGVGLPLWVTEHTSAPAWIVSVLVMTNTVLAVALQVRFASRGESVAIARRAMALSGIAQAVFCLVVAATGRMPPVAAAVGLVLSVVALTAGELWSAAGSWALSYRFAPEHRQGEYLAVFSLGATIQDVLGPLVVTLAILPHGGPGWVGAAAVLLVLATLARPAAAWLERTQATRTAGVAVVTAQS